MRLKVTPAVKKKLKFYLDNAFTRREAYARFAKEFKCSISAVRKLASRLGYTSKGHSMHFYFTVKEEEDLVNICRKYANRGEPLTIPDLIELASRYMRFPKNKKISRHFVTDFAKRHKDELCVKAGKETSPSRSSDVMDVHTREFVDELDPLFRENRINRNNLFVFDETIIGETARKQLVIGPRRKSGGGNINKFSRRVKALGCYIPFSKCDGSTPFRVFVMRDTVTSKPPGPNGEPEENVRVVRTATLYRLYLSSRYGYLTIPLFICILNHFSKWWNESFSGLDCYLICDELRIHVNDDIVQFANSKGIHIKTIMPGSSHWFQVHDQLPFGQLKKKYDTVKK